MAESKKTCQCGDDFKAATDPKSEKVNGVAICINCGLPQKPDKK
jgi:hypothetical protein